MSRASSAGRSIKCVNTDATRLSTAVRQLAGEVRQPVPAEVFYRHGVRHVHKLVPLARVTSDHVPYLGRGIGGDRDWAAAEASRP